LSVTAVRMDPSAASTQQGAKTRVLLIDDAGILRDGLCALLQSDGGIEVVATAGSRGEAMRTLRQLRPQLVIMDLSRSLRTGPETIAQLKSRWPEVRVLVLSLVRDRPLIEAALRAGADGYLHKNESRAELFAAVQRLAGGKGYVRIPALEKMSRRSLKSAEVARFSAQQTDALTRREREVIEFVARGYRTREMALLMSVSHKTVEKHRTNLMRKLGLRSAAAVAAFAITHGYG
jgi:two-component system, NarL family, response regulator NreC